MKRWRVLAILAAAGAIALWFLFPRHDISLQSFHLALDRDQAIERLRQEAARYGIDTAGLKPQVRLALADAAINLKAAFPQAPALRPFSGARIRVAAASAAGRVEATFFEDGRPEAFQSSLTRIRTTPEEELAHYAGPDAARFAAVTSGASGRGGLQYTWEWTDPTDAEIVARFELLQNDGKTVRTRYSVNASDRVLEAARRSNHRHSLDSLTTSGTFMIFAGLAAAFWTFFRSLTRRTDHTRFPVRFTLILILLAAVPFVAGVRADDITLGAPGAAAGSAVAAALIGTIFAGTLNYFLLGAGYSLLPESERRPWTGMQLVSKSRFLARRVGQEALAGLVAAIPLLAIVLAGAAALGRVERLYGIGFLMSPRPAVSMLDGVYQFDIIGVFGMFLPLTLWLVKPRAAAWMVVAAGGILFFAAWRRPFETDVWMEIAVSGALFGGLFAVYRYFGLLAAYVAGAAVAALHHTLAFEFQANAGLADAGLEAAGIYAAAAAGAGVLARWGRAYDEDAARSEMSPQASDISWSQRDRLRADFAVARRAQQDLLPAGPPRVPGLDVAAACRPAREVGGDLFEFLRLPDGRTGFCVADVSGKGVPAALYMTLTTGILAASAGRSSNIREVTVELNRHLHTACKHRTFVTMALGAWDERARCFEHVRAGHNPLLHRPARGGAHFVQPGGLGLGLVRGGLFDNALETHRIELAPGDMLVLYSDGLVEAMNPRNEQFGEDRLKEAVEQCAGLTAASVQARILEAVDRFTEGAEPHDDLTIMVLAAVPA